MAKLFEEVLNGTSHSPTADVLINFACPGEAPGGALGSPLLPSHAGGAGVASPGGPGAIRPAAGEWTLHTARPTSPRALPVSRTQSTGSPVRNSAQGSNAEAPAQTLPGHIRCHSLVLRTQPTLMDKLFPNFNKSRRTCSSSGTVGGASDALEPEPLELERTASWPDPGPGDRALEGQSQSEQSVACSCEYERLAEVTVDDEPEVFLEMIKFVYLNTCTVDHSNVKILIQMAGKYGIEDIVRHCLQWLQDNFTADLFYQFLSFELTSPHFGRLLRQSLRSALRSRRHFSLVTAEESKWEQLPVSFMESMLSGDELPIVSEAEVLHLLARWAKGAKARQDRNEKLLRSPGPPAVDPAHDSPLSRHRSPPPLTASASEAEGEDPDGGCGPEAGAAKSEATTSTRQGEDGRRAGAGALGQSLEALPHAHEDMLRLLRALRKSDMLIKLSDIEPILEILNLSSMFSTKTPRETPALDPGFVIYRGVGGVSAPTNYGETHQPNVTSQPWRGGSVSLSACDFLQQHDGFRPSCVPDGDVMVYPRLCVRLTCSSWSHREKRIGKNVASMARHSISGPIGGDPMSSWDSVSSTLISTMTPVNESGPLEKPPAVTLKTMQSQDDWEIGRKARPASAVPNLSDSEKIDHKVVASVISGRMRHGIRIGQHERSSIYDIEGISDAQCEDACLGGTPTEVEFELQLTSQAPSPSGICRCSLQLWPAGGGAGSTGSGGGTRLSESRFRSGQSAGSTADERAVPGLVNADQQRVSTAGGLALQGTGPEPLLEICFDASAEESLHFHIASHHFDSNSVYHIALNWGMRAGMART